MFYLTLYTGITMKVTVMSVLLYFLLSLVEMHAQTFPFMRFNATILPNHSYVDFNLVGNITDESVRCRTNLTTCNNVFSVETGTSLMERDCQLMQEILMHMYMRCIKGDMFNYVVR